MVAWTYVLGCGRAAIQSSRRARPITDNTVAERQDRVEITAVVGGGSVAEVAVWQRGRVAEWQSGSLARSLPLSWLGD